MALNCVVSTKYNVFNLKFDSNNTTNNINVRSLSQLVWRAVAISVIKMKKYGIRY